VIHTYIFIIIVMKSLQYDIEGEPFLSESA